MAERGGGVTRRRFIWLSVAGAAGAGATAGGALWWRGHAGTPAVHPAVGARLRTLTAAEHTTLSAAIETLTAISTLAAPRTPGAPTIADEAALHLDAFLAEGPKADVDDVHALLWLVEHGSFVLMAGAERFSRLGPAHREKYLDRWSRSSVGLLRTGFRVLKQMAAVATYRLPETWAAIGYDGPNVPPGWDVYEHGGAG